VAQQKLAREWGLPPELCQGKLSSRVKQLMDYNKAKHRTEILLPEWSKDGYYKK
jgi:hypothetical protein